MEVGTIHAPTRRIDAFARNVENGEWVPFGSGDSPFSLTEARRAGIPKSNAKSIGNINNPGDYIEINGKDTRMYEQYVDTLEGKWDVVVEDGNTFIVKLLDNGKYPDDINKVD